jgi:hypothetical protein
LSALAFVSIECGLKLGVVHYQVSGFLLPLGKGLF